MNTALVDDGESTCLINYNVHLNIKSRLLETFHWNIKIDCLIHRTRVIVIE